MFFLWIKFIVSAAVVVFAGYKICIYADRIARATKIGHVFIGLILLAVVTSLPELAVTISATKIGALDLAVGDLFGSNLFNLTVVALIFLYFIKEPKRISFASTHFISAGFSVLLISLAAMGIICYKLFYPYIDYSPIFVNVETALILAIYIFGAFLVFRTESAATPGVEETAGEKQKAAIWLKFAGYAFILVGFAVYLSHLGASIARIPVRGVALGGTFVGGLLIAITTSLPEMAVAISAMKLGFLDMALANIFGSNMFNMFIIPITDLVLGKKVLLSCVSSQHLFTILFVIISTVLVISGLAYRSRRKTPALSWDSAAILFIYFAANILNFYMR